jgi:hypothetical protein
MEVLLNPLFIPETGGSVSLKDVLDATPAESQEETRVMQSIEQYDPTGSSSRHFDQATSIPAELAASLSVVSEEEEGLSSASAAHPQTVEDELFAFTTSINKIHFDQVTGEDDDAPPPAEIFRDNDKKANTQFDVFAADAGKLFHRFHKRLPPKPQSSSSGDYLEDGRRSTHQRMTHGGVEKLRDFRDLVVSNKAYTFAYVKNTLLFVIIPATGLACL